MMTCSATETTLEPETSRTSRPFSAAALRSTWSEPTPAVMQILRFFACQERAVMISRLDLYNTLILTFSMRSRVR